MRLDKSVRVTRLRSNVDAYNFKTRIVVSLTCSPLAAVKVKYFQNPPSPLTALRVHVC